MTVKSIRLELARDTKHPDGDPNHGYEFRAPLTMDGYLDANAWRTVKPFCTVRRFSPGSDDERGLLLRTKGAHWVFSYDSGEDDDEPAFRFSSHKFAPGEYVSTTPMPMGLMNHQYRHVGCLQHLVGDPAKKQLPQPAMGISTHDEQPDTGFLCVIQNQPCRRFWLVGDLT